jgi:anionic cell wall polymer biosynthesis LytR-Cps2A-Psr (LCP) family protein
MSTQRAFSPDFPEPLPERRSIPTARPRRRRLRFFLLGLVLFLLSIIGSAAVLIYSPAVLEAMSTMILKPQPGVVPWNGQDRITLIAMGLTQRTTEPARTDTILAIDIDPATHRINELSVPRDLWVDIPGYG